jgi:sugar phosphate isomerase/epimerase
VTRIRQLARACAGHGIVLAVEAVGIRAGLPASLDGPHEVASTLPQLRTLLDRARDGGAGGVTACVDSVHWAAAGGHAADFDGLPVGHVQIADVPAGVPAARWTDAARLFPGDGILDWPVLGGALAGGGYAGPASVELFNPLLRELPDDDIARRALTAARGCWEKGAVR